MTAPELATAAADAAQNKPLIITEPGVYNLTTEQYHADPVPGGSLSSTGARRLLPPSCPALFKHQLEQPPAPTEEMNLGSAAHRVALGAGADIVVLLDAEGEPFTDYRTKACKAARDAAKAAGKIPLLQKHHQLVQDMAAALRADPVVGELFQHAAGRAEQAIFWRDGSIMKRALIDWLPVHVPGFRAPFLDYKTAVRADPESVRKAIYNYGLHQQFEWYRDGIAALDLLPNPDGLFVFQEKTAPYLTLAVRLDMDTQQIARRLNHEATILYKECRKSGVWPGYSDTIETLGVPEWVKRQYDGESW